MKKPDLLILIIIWEFLSATIALVGMAAIIIFAFPVVLKFVSYPRAGGLFGLSVAEVLLFTYVALAVTAGAGLIIGREWGRITAIIHAVLSLFSIPFGTTIGILSLIYLNRPEVKEYCQSTQKKPFV
ncbi:MAG: hypothetical protein PHU08_07905 [Dehalococcoidales bacterium]|nr:hypothetical protein [Dehalococcoidales bacterium]